MSLSAASAKTFFDEIARDQAVWAIKDADGFPTSNNVMPFWSLERRAATHCSTVAGYADFAPFELSLTDFTQRWLPGLQKDGLRVGLNWYGPNATGYDFEPDEVLTWLGTQ